MRDHYEEESEVDVGHQRAEAASETPDQGHHQVGGVVNFPRVGVPTVDEQHSGVALDVLCILDMPEGRKEVAPDHLPALLHLEIAFVVVGLVPNPVGNQQRPDKDRIVKRHRRRQHKVRLGEARQEQRLVAVQERHAREVPPAQHPTKSFCGDVPGVRNEMFALGCSVAIEPVRKDHEQRGIQPCIEVPRSLDVATNRDEEQQCPRDAGLRHHLHIYVPQPGVQPCAHEEVVHAQDFRAPGEDKVDDDGIHVSQHHRRGQERRVLMDEGGEVEDLHIMQTDRQRQRQIKRAVRVAQVAQATYSWNGDAGHDRGEDELGHVVNEEPCHGRHRRSVVLQARAVER
mmetsp:Transcript_18176/g.49873  ORF Transcript_18176/g.49873 Transcript_18176/m.49873 type:complete len:343 (+) Transcript_18176:234-1262(+)